MAIAALSSDLLDLVSKLGDDIALDICASCIVFPRTDNLSKDNPRIVYVVNPDADVNEVKGFADAKARAASEPELVALNANQDVAMALELLGKLQKHFALDKFDYVQVYRGGVDLVRLDYIAKYNSRPCGRSVYFEINEYRRRLISAVLAGRKFTQNPYIVVLLAGVVGIAGSMVGSALLKWLGFRGA